jgi:hypothetical protein
MPAWRWTALKLARRRMETSYTLVLVGDDAWKRLGHKNDAGAVGGKDRRRSAGDHTKQAMNVRVGGLPGVALLVGSAAVAVADREQSAGVSRRDAGAECTAQQQLEGERTSHQHGKPWPHAMVGSVQAQHEALLPQGLANSTIRREF